MIVLVPPTIERDGVPSEVGGKLRSALTINCPAYGRPTPKLTWLRAGRPFDYSHDVYLSANGMKLHFIDLKKVGILNKFSTVFPLFSHRHHILYHNQVIFIEEDEDRYTCIARNAAGEDKRDFTLKLLGTLFLVLLK